MFELLFSKLSHLPVMHIAADATLCFSDPLQTAIITSETASGKTMLIPAACAHALALQDLDEVIYVLEPSRFLANNAMDSLIQIMGPDAENLVGCVVGGRNGDVRRTRRTNKIIFTTVGYMLSSKLIQTERNIILDEAHDTTIDLSLAKALIKYRRDRGEAIRLAIMSATIDPVIEQRYWGQQSTQTFHTTGQTFPVQVIEQDINLSTAVRQHIEVHNRSGILVFVSGVAEIEEAAEEIEEMLNNIDLKDRIYEIHEIHGKSDMDVRAHFSQSPDSNVIKIGIGTNVIESGSSLPWVDSGCSSGRCKTVKTAPLSNAHSLCEDDLPQWRITQQIGRCNRFRDGVFILASKVPRASRSVFQSPEIKRLPLTDLVMTCAKMRVPLDDLVFNELETPSKEDLSNAIRILVSLGFVTRQDGHILSLTEDGIFIDSAALSFRAAAALCQAKALNIVEEALPLIAMMECGDIRRDFRQPLGGVISVPDSDLINAVCVMTDSIHQIDVERNKTVCTDNNISFQRIKEYKEILSGLVRNRWAPQYNTATYMPNRDGSSAISTALKLKLKTIILRAKVDDCYVSSGMSIRPKNVFMPENFSNTSVTNEFWGQDLCAAVATRRQITPKNSRPFVVAENVTLFNKEEFEYALTYVRRNSLFNYEFPQSVVVPKADLPVRPGIADVFRIMRASTPVSTKGFTNPYETSEPSMGTLGDILREAQNRKAG